MPEGPISPMRRKACLPLLPARGQRKGPHEAGLILVRKQEPQKSSNRPHDKAAINSQIKVTAKVTATEIPLATDFKIVARNTRSVCLRFLPPLHTSEATKPSFLNILPRTVARPCSPPDTLLRPECSDYLSNSEAQTPSASAIRSML